MASFSNGTDSLREENGGDTTIMRLSDCICPICLYILVEPVTMPCRHELCMHCFKQNVQEASLTCPMCRLRISTWARRATRNNKLVNLVRWEAIKQAFPRKVEQRLQGIEGSSSSDEDEEVQIPMPRLAEPGEIRSEYEAEIQRLQEERDMAYQEEIERSKPLIVQLQMEEERRRLELEEQKKRDEELAKELADALNASSSVLDTPDIGQFLERRRLPGDSETTPRAGHRSNPLMDRFLESGRQSPGNANKDNDDKYPYTCVSPWAKEEDSGKRKTEADRPPSNYSEIFTDTNRPNSFNSAASTVSYVYVDSRPESADMAAREVPQVQISNEEVQVDGFGKASNPHIRVIDLEQMYKDFPEHSPSPVDDTEVTDVTEKAMRSPSRDSISQEMSHFKPIRTCPRTPPRRLPGGKVCEPTLVRSTPINAQPTQRCLSLDCLSPDGAVGSPIMHRQLLALGAERQAQVQALSKGTCTEFKSKPLKKLLQRSAESQTAMIDHTYWSPEQSRHKAQRTTLQDLCKGRATAATVTRQVSPPKHRQSATTRRLEFEGDPGPPREPPDRPSKPSSLRTRDILPLSTELSSPSAVLSGAILPLMSNLDDDEEPLLPILPPSMALNPSATEAGPCISNVCMTAVPAGSRMPSGASCAVSGIAGTVNSHLRKLSPGRVYQMKGRLSLRNKATGSPSSKSNTSRTTSSAKAAASPTTSIHALIQASHTPRTGKPAATTAVPSTSSRPHPSTPPDLPVLNLFPSVDDEENRPCVSDHGSLPAGPSLGAGDPGASLKGPRVLTTLLTPGTLEQRKALVAQHNYVDETPPRVLALNTAAGRTTPSTKATSTPTTSIQAWMQASQTGKTVATTAGPSTVSHPHPSSPPDLPVLDLYPSVDDEENRPCVSDRGSPPAEPSSQGARDPGASLKGPRVLTTLLTPGILEQRKALVAQRGYVDETPPRVLALNTAAGRTVKTSMLQQWLKPVMTTAPQEPCQLMRLAAGDSEAVSHTRATLSEPEAAALESDPQPSCSHTGQDWPGATTDATRLSPLAQSEAIDDRLLETSAQEDSSRDNMEVDARSPAATAQPEKQGASALNDKATTPGKPRKRSRGKHKEDGALTSPSEMSSLVEVDSDFTPPKKSPRRKQVRSTGRPVNAPAKDINQAREKENVCTPGRLNTSAVSETSPSGSARKGRNTRKTPLKSKRTLFLVPQCGEDSDDEGTIGSPRKKLTRPPLALPLVVPQCRDDKLDDSETQQNISIGSPNVAVSSKDTPARPTVAQQGNKSTPKTRRNRPGQQAAVIRASDSDRDSDDEVFFHPAPRGAVNAAAEQPPVDSSGEELEVERNPPRPQRGRRKPKKLEDFVHFSSNPKTPQKRTKGANISVLPAATEEETPRIEQVTPRKGRKRIVSEADSPQRPSPVKHRTVSKGSGKSGNSDVMASDTNTPSKRQRITLRDALNRGSPLSPISASVSSSRTRPADNSVTSPASPENRVAAKQQDAPTKRNGRVRNKRKANESDPALEPLSGLLTDSDTGGSPDKSKKTERQSKAWSSTIQEKDNDSVSRTSESENPKTAKESKRSSDVRIIRKQCRSRNISDNPRINAPEDESSPEKGRKPRASAPARKMFTLRSRVTGGSGSPVEVEPVLMTVGVGVASSGLERTKSRHSEGPSDEPSTSSSVRVSKGSTTTPVKRNIRTLKYIEYSPDGPTGKKIVPPRRSQRKGPKDVVQTKQTKLFFSSGDDDFIESRPPSSTSQAAKSTGTSRGKTRNQRLAEVQGRLHSESRRGSVESEGRSPANRDDTGSDFSADKDIHEVRRERSSFATDDEYRAYMEEQDFLLAKACQEQYDLEVRYNLTAIRKKGSDGQYMFRPNKGEHKGFYEEV